MSRSATVAAELGLRLVVPGHGGVPLTASVCYRDDDPYAIRMSFHVGMDDPVEWLFARDLLAVGMQTPVGEGDVRVWPAHGATDVLFLHLRAPSGEALFELSRATVAGFLRETEALVPTGAETTMLALDEELQALLSGGGADPTAR